MSTRSTSFSGRLGRFASFNVGQHVWLAVLSLVATPIVYHRLGEAAYGLLSVVNLVAAQLSILEFGFGHATIRRLSQSLPTDDVAEMSRTLATSSWVFLATAVVGSLTILATADLLAEGYFRIPPELLGTGKLALRIGAAFFAASILGNLASAAWQGLQRFGFVNLVSGLSASAQLLGSVVLVLVGVGVIGLLWWSVVLGFVVLLVHGWWLRRKLPVLRPFGRPDRRAFREMAGFGLLLMMAGVFTQVFVSGGALVLGHYVLVGVLPFFTVPFGLYQRLNRVGYGLASALYPLVAELDGRKDHDSLQRVFVSGTRILIVAGVTAMAPAVLVAAPFLALWMGPDFAKEGGRVLEVLFVAFALSLATTPSVELARGTGRGGWLVTYTGLLAAVNLGGALLLARTWGPLGAAMAFLVAQSVGSAFLIGRVGGADCLQVLSLRLVVLSVGAMAATLWTLQATSSPLVRLAVATGLGLVLVVLGVTWILSRDERSALYRMVSLS